MKIIVTGAIAYDVIMNLPGKFSSYILPDKLHQINVSFATDTHTKSFGGTAGNQAYSLALLGATPLLVGTVGNDFAPYKKFLIENGVDISNVQVIKNKQTASGFAITDEVDNQIWGFSRSAMDDAKDLSVRSVVDACAGSGEEVFVVITPNGVQAIVNYIDECVESGIPFAFDPAFYIPTLRVESLRKGVEHARIVFGNDYEIALLQEKLNLVKQGLILTDQVIVTTLGEKGSVIKYKESQNQAIKEIKVKPAKVAKVVDPTGAGDAYRSGFLAGYTKGFSLQVCGQMGSVASAFVVEKKGTVNHRYTVEEFKSRYKENFGPLSF